MRAREGGNACSGVRLSERDRHALPSISSFIFSRCSATGFSRRADASADILPSRGISVSRGSPTRARDLSGTATMSSYYCQKEHEQCVRWSGGGLPVRRVQLEDSLIVVVRFTNLLVRFVRLETYIRALPRTISNASVKDTEKIQQLAGCVR